MPKLISRLVVISLAVLQAGPGTGAIAAANQGPRGIGCRACILVDDSGAVLWARRAHRPRPNASTTKMLTALTVMRLGADPAAEVTVSERAAATGGGGLDLSRGEVFTVDQLLHALLMSSSNDASVALAEYASGSVGSFVGAMNRLAFDLGARDSRFVTPHGLDAPGHYSTASDLAALGTALLRRGRLARIVASKRYRLATAAGTETLENSNPLVGTYRGAMGIKTGFTDGAGEVLVAAARRHRRRLISVAMGSRNAAADSRALLNYGWDRLGNALLLPEGRRVGEVTLSGGTSAVAVAGSTLRGWARPEEVTSRFVVRRDLSGPTEPGETVGRVELYSGGRRIATAPALSATPLAIPESGSDVVGVALAGLLDRAFDIASWLGFSRP